MKKEFAAHVLEQVFLNADGHLPNANDYDANDIIGALRMAVDMFRNPEQIKVWHDGKEEPINNSKVIICQTGDKTYTVYTMEYHSSDKNFHIISPLGNDYMIGLDWKNIKWAYPEDLLPKK